MGERYFELKVLFYGRMLTLESEREDSYDQYISCTCTCIFSPFVELRNFFSLIWTNSDATH